MKAVQNNGQGVRRLMDYVSRRKLLVGSRLPSIKELAEELELAPHVVRDALLQAQTMGLIQVRPRSGSYVQSVDFGPLVQVFSEFLPAALMQKDRNLFDLLEARRLIEVELAALAATRRRLADLLPLRQAIAAMYEPSADYESYMTQNQNFHLGIARIAGNEVLTGVLECLLVLMRPTLGERQPYTWKDEGSEKRRRDANEHEAIFQALLAADPEAARAAMAAHLQDTTNTLLPQPKARRKAATPARKGREIYSTGVC
jgi:GntR family transcriptional regulator, transcriptional repressor for pyruvate dehydrogenase complex